MSKNQDTQAQLLARASELLSKKPYTKEDSSLFDSYVKLASAMEDAPAVNEDRNAEASKSLRSYLSTGERRTYAAMSASVEGGYIVTQSFYAKVTAMLAAVDPLFDQNVVTMFEDTHGGTLKAPVMTDETQSASIVSENTDGTEQEITFSGLSLAKADTWRSGKFVYSQQLAQDSAFPMEDVIAKAAAVRFRRGIGAANVATLVSQASKALDAANVSSVTLDNVLDLLGSINADYQASPKFRVLMNQATLTNLLKQKDSSGKYQKMIEWDDDAKVYVIAGKPIAISPSVDSVGANKVPVVAGDLSYFFNRIVKNSMSLLVYSQAPGLVEYGLRAAQAFVRTNAGLLVTGSSKPVQYVKCPAS
jgi:HK97 family phage major capsid protein